MCEILFGEQCCLLPSVCVLPGGDGWQGPRIDYRRLHDCDEFYSGVVSDAYFERSVRPHATVSACDRVCVRMVD